MQATFELTAMCTDACACQTVTCWIEHPQVGEIYGLGSDEQSALEDAIQNVLANGGVLYPITKGGSTND